RSWEGDRHDGSASLLWVARPGLLFQGDKQSSCHPLVSMRGQESIRGLSCPALSRPPRSFLGDFFFLPPCFVPIAKSQELLFPQSLSWALGYNSSLAVHSLAGGEDWVLLYVCSHTAVIHDILGGRQYHLQGHANTISCLCVSEDRRWVATADGGPDPLVIDFVVFNPQNPHEFVSNSKTQVIFYLWSDASLQYSTPPLTKQTFNSMVGHFSQSAFHFNNTQALTGTSAGKLVLWDMARAPSLSEEAQVQPHNTKATKLVPMQRSSITVLMVLESCIVTGDVKGRVKFYNGRLQLLACYSHSGVGPICSISFSKPPPEPPDPASLIHQILFLSLNRNFILSTSDATVLHVATDGTNFEKVMEEAKKATTAIACHPRQALLAVGSHCGLLKVWDYQQPKYLVSRIFTEAGIQCLSYDPEGCFLAAGFTDGSVYILDAISLQSCCEAFRFSRGAVTHISFSHDSEYLATADEKYAVTVYKRVLQNGQRCWEHLAGLHSHYKPIRSILFGVQLDSNEPRLLSLGEDRQLVEYDLSSSSKDQLVISHRDRVEQVAVPLCLAWYPQFGTESFILTANSCYKMKLYNTTTKMCRKTLLGPTYGSPLEKIQILPTTSTTNSQKCYLAYITRDKVGLQILPVDGNPHKSSAFICHPDGVSDLACSYDGRYVFTAGGNDRTVLKWEVNLNALEAAASLGGEDLVPFYSLLEGGREGEFFRELEDYFYYVQLRSQGIDALETRQVSTHIPLEEIPSVMRAMGFYPSEEEVCQMFLLLFKKKKEQE
uniref:Cilia- and flagella-associated protein 251 n=1 Tax=Anas zonorhyncha TaxID=75864 RepID=A0A8B9US50_9AVES